MRKILFKLHLIVAIVFGVFIVLLGVTGAEMAFEQEIDHVTHWRLTYVKPQGQPMSLAQISDAIGKKFPDEKIGAYFLSTSPNMSYAVVLKDRLAYINEYTGEVLGTRVQEMDWQGYVHQMHLRLAMLDKGRKFGETTIKASGVAALFLVITGAYLWWPVKRVAIGKNDGTRRFWFDIHNSFGIIALIFVLAATVTGLIIAFEAQTNPLLYKLTGSQEAAQPPLVTTPVPGAKPITPDEAVEIARKAVPGASPFLVIVPHGKQVYRIAARFPEDLTPGGRTRVAIDPYSGKVIFAIDSRTGPGGYRANALNRAIHTGDIFGTASKIVMSLASLVMAMQLVTGVVMWIKRRKAEKKARPAAA